MRSMLSAPKVALLIGLSIVRWEARAAATNFVVFDGNDTNFGVAASFLDTNARTFSNGPSFDTSTYYATARFGAVEPDPCAFGVGCGFHDAAVGLSLLSPVGGSNIGSSGHVDLTFSFSTAGPGPITRLNVSGLYQILLGTSAVSPSSIRDSEQASAFLTMTETPSLPAYNLFSGFGCQNFGSTSFAGCTSDSPFSFDVETHTGSTVYFTMRVDVSLMPYASAYALEGSAFIDPYIRTLDSGYSLAVESGVTNVPLGTGVAAVPEPSVFDLSAAGLIGVFAAIKHRRRVTLTTA